MANLDELKEDRRIKAYLVKHQGDRTYSVVQGLCDILLHTHRLRPTAELLRNLIGRGSNTTIQRAINDFHAQAPGRSDEAPVVRDVPAEVLDAAGDLWRLSMRHASDSFADERAQMEGAVAEAKKKQLEAEENTLEFMRSVGIAQDAERAALDREAAAKELAESAQAARDRAERDADEARQALVRAHDEVRDAQRRADEQIKAANDRADQATAAIEERFEGLRVALLRDTAERRDAMQAEHTKVLAEVEAERQRFAQDKHRLEMALGDVRMQLNAERQNRASATEQLAVAERLSSQQEREISRLNRQIERLMQALERLSQSADARPAPPASADGVDGEEDPIVRMQAVMRAVHGELANDEGVAVLGDWQLESVERYQDEYGLQPHLGDLFDAALSAMEEAGEGFRWF